MAFAGIVGAALSSALIGLRAARTGPDAGMSTGESFTAEMESGEKDGNVTDDQPPETDTSMDAMAGADTAFAENIQLSGMTLGQVAQPDSWLGAVLAEPSRAESVPLSIDTPPAMQPVTGPRTTVMTSIWYALEGAGGPAPFDPAVDLAPDRSAFDGGGSARTLPDNVGYVLQSADLATFSPKAMDTDAARRNQQATAPAASLSDDRSAAALNALTSLYSKPAADGAIPVTAKIEVTPDRSIIVMPRPEDHGGLQSTQTGTVEPYRKIASFITSKTPSLPPGVAIPALSGTVLDSVRLAGPSAGPPPRPIVPDIRMQPPAMPDAAPVQHLPTVSETTSADDASSPFSIGATPGSVPSEAMRDGPRITPFVSHSTPAWPGSGSVAQQLVFALSPTRAGATEIILSPAELGKVRLTLRADDNAITLQVIAERPETADLMRRHIDNLVQEFRLLGYQSITLDFGQSHDQGRRADSQGDADHGAAAPAKARNDGTRQDIYPAVDASPDLSGAGRGSAQLDLRM